MLYSIKNREDSENLIELVSLQNKVTALRLQNKLAKKNFHEDMKKVIEQVTETIKVVSEDVTRPMMETPIQNKKALESLKRNF